MKFSIDSEKKVENKKKETVVKNQYGNRATTLKGYKDQLIYYYNTGIGRVSEIAGVVINKNLISVIEKRYKMLGGILPINPVDIDAKKGKGWKLLG
tara:strand:+ start:576 stop:863 length:288 start_codon:yes stop_codon:yes gene_type:complete